ncbi:Type III secretion outermembrane pore forming protein (YscC,MxiD,HrcC, InvG) [Pseudomonas sp. R5-89-07]|nr:Type III secretion outermembrane pore forming protein (YscC,MxiD,HrcC, InvG) [Pseudomonas sp. R5-89-07]
MPADSANTTNHYWLGSTLLWGALLLVSCVAWGEPYEARDESLDSFFTALAVPLGMPVVVSREAAHKRVSGTFDFEAPQQVLEALARQEGLIWHSDGQAVHLYDAAEARTSAVALRYISVNRLRGIMRRTGLDESRYPLRDSGVRTFYVSGPPSYVNQVLRLAQLTDRQRSELRVGAHAFGVVQVFNTSVEDRQYGTGANKVSVPGIASIIRGLLASEQKGPLADKNLTLIAYPDTNSLLIKGKPAQVSLIEKLVEELDVPKQLNEISSWRAEVSRDESKPPAGPPLLTAAQYERVQRAFVRLGRERSP